MKNGRGEKKILRKKELREKKKNSWESNAMKGQVIVGRGATVASIQERESRECQIWETQSCFSGRNEDTRGGN